MVLSYIAGPIIGAVIGYCTNFIAVKMLFFPKKEVRIGGVKLPFTPGVIPKGKDRLALAVGDVVGNKLVTAEDMESQLLSDEVGMKLASSLASKMTVTFKEGLTELTGMSEENYINNKEKVVSAVSDMAADAVVKMDLNDFMMQRVPAILIENLNNPMLAMFMTPELIQQIVVPMGDKLKEAIVEEKEELIKPVIQSKMDEIESAKAADFALSLGFNEAEIESMLSSVILNVMKGCLGDVLAKVNVEGIVRDKIKDMSVDDLENLVLKVMKKELDTIVNLGAVIGFIIGLLMIFF
ncbi:MAG: DUF445 family protein [Firmicutes bacterium]|nr:DUF445 family protein [Bacillota bacterium]